MGRWPRQLEPRRSWAGWAGGAGLQVMAHRGTSLGCDWMTGGHPGAALPLTCWGTLGRSSSLPEPLLSPACWSPQPCSARLTGSLCIKTPAAQPGTEMTSWTLSPGGPSTCESPSAATWPLAASVSPTVQDRAVACCADQGRGGAQPRPGCGAMAGLEGDSLVRDAAASPCPSGSRAICIRTKTAAEA